MIKSIFITAFNRNKHFFITLKKLMSCKNYDQYKKLIIYQDIDNKTFNKIKLIDPKIEVINSQFEVNCSSIYKCNFNTYLGFKKCFESYRSEYVIFLEDDVLPAYDFLKFHDHVILQNRYDPKFFAANSFSREYGANLDFAYSKFIYGIGKGWSLAKPKWRILKKMFKELFQSKKNEFYDCFFEHKIRYNYYVVMPYRSRTLEQPNNGLNFKYSYFKTSFYKSWKKSFLGKDKFSISKYNFLQQINYKWAGDAMLYEDCLEYTKFNIFKTKVKFLYIKLKEKIKKNIGIENTILITNIKKKTKKLF
jgi:hypothetical protein